MKIHRAEEKPKNWRLSIVNIINDFLPAIGPHIDPDRFDINPSIDFVMELLKQEDERACDILLARYRDDMPYRNIAEKYNVSRERVRQIINKTLLNTFVQTQPHRDILVYGIAESIARAKGMGYRAGKEHADRKQRQEIYNEGYKKGYADGCEHAGTNSATFIPSSDFNTPFGAIIHDVRAQRRLRAEGKRTVGDVLELTYDELMRMRNIGVGTVAKIAQDLERAGYNAEHLNRCLKYEKGV